MHIIDINKVRCSQCQSLNVARTVNETPSAYVCLDCGHREEPPKIYVYPNIDTATWVPMPVDNFVEF